MHNRIVKELKSKTQAQLEKEVQDKSAEIVKLAGELSTGRLKNVRILKAARIHLARTKTILRELQIRILSEVIK